MALNSVSGQHYSTYSEPVRQWTQDFLVTYLTDAKRFSHILDIGCGTGENTKFLQNFCSADNIIGLDVNPSFLNFSERNSQHRCIHYFEADMNKSSWIQDDYRVNKFDLVFSSFALHWIKDIERVFKEIAEIMTEDGESFHVIGIKPSEAFRNTMKQMIFHPKWIDYLENFRKAPEWLTKNNKSAWNMNKNPANIVQSYLIDSGHEVLLCEEVDVTYTCKSHNESKGLLQWLLPLTKYIPQTKIANFMEDAHAIYRKYSNLEHDQIVMKNAALVVHSKLKCRKNSLEFV